MTTKAKEIANKTDPVSKTVIQFGCFINSILPTLFERIEQLETKVEQLNTRAHSAEDYLSHLNKAAAEALSPRAEMKSVDDACSVIRNFLTKHGLKSMKIFPHVLPKAE